MPACAGVLLVFFFFFFFAFSDRADLNCNIFSFIVKPKIEVVSETFMY